MHSAGCNHIPVFNADIRSGYSIGAFAFPSAAHLPFRFQHGSQLPHALCVRAYDFTSASMVCVIELLYFIIHSFRDLSTPNFQILKFFCRQLSKRPGQPSGACDLITAPPAKPPFPPATETPLPGRFPSAAPFVRPSGRRCAAPERIPRPRWCRQWSYCLYSA